MEEPTNTKLVDSSFTEVIGGKNITNTLAKQHEIFNDLIKAGTTSSRLASAAAGSSVLSDIGSSIAKAAGTSAISAFMVGRLDKGENFAPLSGNWH